MKASLRAVLGVVALCCLIGLAGGAGSTITVSEHTTEADFNAGTLTNFATDTTDGGDGYAVSVASTTGDGYSKGEYIGARHSGEATRGFVELFFSGEGTLESNVEIEWQYNDGTGWATDTTRLIESGSGEIQRVESDLTADADQWRVAVSASLKNQSTNPEQVFIYTEGVEYDTQEPQIVDHTADGAGFSDRSPNLSVSVDHPDFDIKHVDELQVEFSLNDGSETHTENVSSAGTVEWQPTNAVMGSNTWEATVTDTQGDTVSTGELNFNTPTTLEIYNESDTDQLINDSVDVEVTFFGDDDQIVTRTTSDGIIDLTGLPTESEYVIQLEAGGYITRQTIITSVFDQQDVFMLPESADSVSTRFEVTDPTGQIQQENSRILIKKPVQRNGSTEWLTVVGDEMGTGGFSTLLERDQRYKIEIEDMTTGQKRDLGPYIATEPETVVLEVDQIDFEFGDSDAGYQWTTDWLDDNGPAIDFAFEAENSLTELEVTITERGGNEIVVHDETYSNENPVQERVVIPESVANVNTSSYTVEWEATVTNADDEEMTVTGSTFVGPRGGIEPDGISDRMLSIVGVFLILMVAGLFSYANIGVGGVVTSLFAGLLWFIGVVPGSVSGLSIGFALLISAMWMVRQSRGPL